jgi:Family of unknown function (DUF6011)
MKKYETDPVPTAEQEEPKITERQREFLLKLLGEKDMTGVDLDKVRAAHEAALTRIMTKSKASELISWALARPNHQQAHEQSVRNDPEVFDQLPDVPAGRYAVENEEDILRFYIVDRPDKGNWKGFVFVSVLASDEKHPIRGNAAKRTILEKIVEAGPKQAAERFGREIGACAICGRTLTDPVSREIGIGPICREGSGWY